MEPPLNLCLRLQRFLLIAMLLEVNTNTLLAVTGITIPLTGLIIAKGILEIARLQWWTRMWNGNPQTGFLFEPSIGGVFNSLRAKQFTIHLSYNMAVISLLLTVPLLNFGKNLLLKPEDCSSQLISGPALCQTSQGVITHGPNAGYIFEASRLVLSGSHDEGKFSWVVGNHAKWLNINPAGNHSEAVVTLSCNQSVTISTSSSLRIQTSEGETGRFLTPHSNVYLPLKRLGIPNDQENSFGSIIDSPNSFNNSLGDVSFWYDIGIDTPRCSVPRECTYFFRQAIFHYSKEAQAIMANNLTDTFNPVNRTTPLSGELTSTTLECTSYLSKEKDAIRTGGFEFYIPNMINQIGIFVSVLGALSNGRSILSNEDKLRKTFPFDERVVKSMMLVDHLAWSTPCDAQYYITRKCTQAPLWLVVLVVAFYLVGALFLLALCAFYSLRPGLREVQTKKGKYVSSRYPVSAWEWYCEWTRQNQVIVQKGSLKESPVEEEYYICIVQEDGVQAIRFNDRENAVQRNPLLLLSEI